MNQFKKAKLRQLEAGKPVEKVSDLQKAGIAVEQLEPEKKENEENDIQKWTKTVKEEEKNTKKEDIKPNNQENVSPVPIPKQVSQVNLQQEVVQRNDTLLKDQTIAQELHTEPVLEQTNTTLVEEQPVLELHAEPVLEQADRTLVVEEQPVQELYTEPVLQQATTESDVITKPTEYIQTKTTFSVNQEHIIDHTIIEEPMETVASIPVVMKPESTPINNVAIPVSSTNKANQYVVPQQEVPVYDYHEPIITTTRLATRNVTATAPVRTTPKKNIPNIFAPKDEAKSMRKSLVLKPTSVKKAESYCSKNGGSFNELIQTLLDNFIEEYGL